MLGGVGNDKMLSEYRSDRLDVSETESIDLPDEYFRRIEEDLRECGYLKTGGYGCPQEAGGDRFGSATGRQVHRSERCLARVRPDPVSSEIEDPGRHEPGQSPARGPETVRWPRACTRRRIGRPMCPGKDHPLLQRSARFR
jgi:hypothetical protein